MSSRSALALCHLPANNNIKNSWSEVLQEACLEHQRCEHQRFTQSVLGGRLLQHGTDGRVQGVLAVEEFRKMHIGTNGRVRGVLGVLES